SEGVVSVTILHSPDIQPGAGCCHAHTTITPDYFRTVGVPLVQGRAFTPADDASARPVIIVDEGLARTLFGGKGAIGKCVAVGSDKTCREIVGVSASARRGTLRTRQGDSQFFVPFAQQGPGGPATVPQLLLVRPQSSSRAAFTSIAAAIRTASPNLPFVSIRRLRDLADEEARAWLMGAKVFGLFGALAVAVAAVGIYGTLAFSIRQRTSEIGVRIALGARPRHIARMVFWHGVLILGIGLTVGPSEI
ncbi:MAG: ABC transporter permease, partial [Vicinamibacterales bacterium]